MSALMRRSFGTTPENRCWTSPPTITAKLGIDVMLYRTAVDRASSMFTLTTRARSPTTVDTSSTIGDIKRHGPHHGAQKSTRTGTFDSRTSVANVPSVRFIADMV